MKPLFLCHPRCTTCKKALQWLEDNHVSCEVRDITTDNPSREELEQWFAQSGLKISRLFNTSGMKYREMGLKDRVKSDPENELLDLLATDGMLVKRPILVTPSKVLFGFREAEYSEILE